MNLNMVKGFNYKEYLSSKDWLLKKNEFINIYLENNWAIECFCCGDTNSLQIHHHSYENVGNEQLHDERINELQFICRDCHRRWHKEEGYKEKIEHKTILEFMNYLSNEWQKQD